MHICLHHYESLNLAGICPKDTSNCQTTCRGAVRFNLHRGACVLLFTRPASCRVQGREETVSVCSGEVGSCRLPPPHLTVTSPLSSATAPARHSSIPSISVSYFSFHMFVYSAFTFSPCAAHPPIPSLHPPFSVFASFGTQTEALPRTALLACFGICICKWEPALLVDLQLSKQPKLTNSQFLLLYQ